MLITGIFIQWISEVFQNFHNQIYEEYKEISCGERNVLFKMKELWFYWTSLFEDSEKMMKKIKKSEKLKVYESVVHEIVDNYELR